MVEGSINYQPYHLRKVAQKALKLLQTSCHPSRVLHEQGIEVDHRVVWEFGVGFGGITPRKGTKEGIDKDDSHLHKDDNYLNAYQKLNRPGFSGNYINYLHSTCCCERVMLWVLPALSSGIAAVKIEGEALSSSIMPGRVVPKKASDSSGSNTSSKR